MWAIGIHGLDRAKSREPVKVLVRRSIPAYELVSRPKTDSLQTISGILFSWLWNLCVNSIVFILTLTGVVTIGGVLAALFIYFAHKEISDYIFGLPARKANVYSVEPIKLAEIKPDLFVASQMKHLNLQLVKIKPIDKTPVSKQMLKEIGRSEFNGKAVLPKESLATEGVDPESRSDQQDTESGENDGGPKQFF